MCLKNGSYLTTEASRREYVQNGEVGIVREIRERSVLVDFPDLGVDVPTLFPMTGDIIGLSYAQTAHKYQGSQAPVVVVVLDSAFGASMVFDRAAAYTAVSRAQEICVLLGTRATLNRCVGRDLQARRRTFLTEEIRRRLP